MASPLLFPNSIAKYRTALLSTGRRTDSNHAGEQKGQDGHTVRSKSKILQDQIPNLNPHSL